MAVETLEIGQDRDPHQITVTLRGNPFDVVRVLAKGLSPESLVQIYDALEVELKRRRGSDVAPSPTQEP